VIGGKTKHCNNMTERVMIREAKDDYWLFTLHPAPCTLHPAPFTLHPAPFTLHPAPCTLHLTHYALHRTPYTLSPKPLKPSKPQVVSREVKDQLIQRAADFHIVLEDIAITHLTFGKEFASAIEKKQVAQQEAERQVMSPNSRDFLGVWGKMPWVCSRHDGQPDARFFF